MLACLPRESALLYKFSICNQELWIEHESGNEMSCSVCVSASDSATVLVLGVALVLAIKLVFV